MNDYETTPQDPAPETAQRDLSRDLGGLVLFALAIFLGVSVVMAASKPEFEVAGTTALVTSFVGLLGTWPLLVLSACLGFLGGRVWIAGATEGLWRNAGWSALLALALALAFGAASAGAGGSFGDATGGALSALVSAWLGVPLALAVVGAVVWFAWLRPPEWQPVLSPDEPAPSVYTPSDTEGLTADEAEALLPSELPEEVLQGEVTGRSIAVAPDLPPLYPPDVRREGRIPDGARALETRDEPAPRTVADAPARPEPTPAPAGLAGEPVAEPARGAAHQAAPLPVQPPAGAAAQGGAGSAVEDLAPAAVPRWERPRDLGREPVVEEEPAPLRAGASLHISTSPVRSAWESEDEDEDEAESAEAEEQDLADAEVVEDEVDEVLAEDEASEEADEEEESEEYEDDEVHAEDDSDQEEDESDDSEEEYEEDEDAEAELDESEEYDEEVEDESEEEDVEDDAEYEDDEAAEFEDEEELEEEAEDDPEVLSEAPADESPLAEDPEVVADVAAAAAAAESEPAAPRPGRAAWEQGGLFDDEPVDAYGTPVELVEALRQVNHETAARIAEPEAETEPTAEIQAAAPEPEVELQPAPRAEKPKPSKSKAKAAKQPAAEPVPAALAGEDDLLFRAGMLFVERGRVAVSMLQRTFDLDFKQATALLDQLQEAGLIGPYLGGQKRDILLTAEEWRERRVGAS